MFYCYYFYLFSFRTGDCLLQIDQVDIVGLRVKDIAALIKKELGDGSNINLQIWRSYDEENNTGGKVDGNQDAAALSGPLPILIRKFIKAVSRIVSILECPVCLETAPSPVSQCVHGHILCASCRTKTLRCPVCRVRLGQGRCLIADEIHRNIKEAFDEGKIAVNGNNSSLREKLFGKRQLKSYDTNGDTKGPIHGSEVLKGNPGVKKKYKIPFSRLLRGMRLSIRLIKNIVNLMDKNTLIFNFKVDLIEQYQQII